MEWRWDARNYTCTYTCTYRDMGRPYPRPAKGEAVSKSFKLSASSSPVPYNNERWEIDVSDEDCIGVVRSRGELWEIKESGLMRKERIYQKGGEEVGNDRTGKSEMEGKVWWKIRRRVSMEWRWGGGGCYKIGTVRQRSNGHQRREGNKYSVRVKEHTVGKDSVGQSSAGKNKTGQHRTAQVFTEHAV